MSRLISNRFRKLDRTRQLLIGVSILNGIGLVMLVAVLSLNSLQKTEGSPQQYQFLSKRIFASEQNDILINFVELRKKLNEYVLTNDEQEIGVYFEYLPSATSIGINEQMRVNIASLLKVPLIMAIYKDIDAGKLSRDQVLTLKEEHLDYGFGDLWELGVGSQITVKEAARLSLQKSDNTASNVLLSALSPGGLDDVANSLNLPREKSGKYIVISPKDYTSVLRSLYLSAYVDKDSSNEILDLLTGSIFHDQLTAGVPKDVKVAHKNGEYTVGTPAKPVFSDCGIVYIPKRPYALCVMTLSNRTQANKHISEISKLVFDYVSEIN
jgi:beta-lactamase class A